MYEPGSWRNPDYYDYERSEPICRECEEHYQRLDNAREFFDEITDILYGTKPLDISHLERCLDELGHHLGINMKPRDFMPNVGRKIHITNFKI